MNRRDLLKWATGGGIGAMTAGEVATVDVAKVGPRDVIVFEAPGSVSDAVAQRIQDYAERVWPGRKIIVMGDGLKIRIMREDGA